MYKESTKKAKRRVAWALFWISTFITLLFFRVAWMKVISAEDLSRRALSYQMRDETIDAKRGKIYDKNGKELAASAITYSIWVRPSDLAATVSGKDSNEQKEKTIAMVAKATGKSESEIKKEIKDGGRLIKVGKHIEKEKAEKLRDKRRPGIEMQTDIKRYYPLGEFASHILGSVTDDNAGISGVELKYEQFLKGVPGRWIKETDALGKNIAYGKEKYYPEKNGLNLVLTIDEVVQHYVENDIKETKEKYNADRVTCLMMNPKTGEVIAMASYPDYDPNNARVPLDPEEAKKLEKMSSEEKMEYWNKMWRNPMINDTYEPGSTFKLLTASMALEERLTNLNEGFVCNSFYTIAGQKFRCPAAHGQQNLLTAMKNSCNPVMATLAHRIGVTKFYDYMDLFGITSKTNIDYPGEGHAILQDKKNAGPVGLATMSYGQGIAITPIQLLTAVCAFGNEGKLMEPHLVTKLTDKEGKTIKSIEPKVVRQVVSKQTADELALIMENDVANGNGKTAVIPGYRVGGKTGTSQKPKNGKYTQDFWSSFVGMAPMEDPQIAILVIVDTPRVGAGYGNIVAAPLAKTILEKTLRYMHIQPNYTQEETGKLQKQKIRVPNLVGKGFGNAYEILGNINLKYTVSPALKEGESLADAKVVDQYPKPGDLISAGGSVALYRE